jgi:NADH:ubiquinone oxidoreductase subunit F (NADH-binding)/(2Fe-2S) ferredoxin
MKEYRAHLMVCGGTGCVSNNAFKIKEALDKEIKKYDLQDEVIVVMTGCNGFCAQGPIMVVQPDGVFYQMLTEKDIPHLVEEHLLKGRPVHKLMYTPTEEEKPIPKMSDIGFFSKQLLIALRNRGLIDPEKIDEYIAREGYKAMAKALTSMNAEEIIKEVKNSGLRGRGGAGFPTGKKWEITRSAAGSEKYIICNADEGDPGAFMDRSVIEADPHSVLEGMVIGAKAIGSSHGFIYIRNEYPLALERLYKAIEQAREYGLLGKDILGTGFDFDITVHRGAGAFVCGEETALMACIEGRVGRPRPRPPYPSESGLWGKSTNINNVETWANVPPIILRGGKWFSEIGTKTSKGTKVFSLVGKINNTGLVEVPMGITLREIIYEIGGGIPNVGSMMGSGGMVVMDESTCMVDVAKYFLAFCMDESCGQCTPCREGIERMLDILNEICEGRGKEGDIEVLEELSHAIADGSLCALGGTAPNPVLTTIKYFRDEYEAHIKEKRCPAHVCKALIQYFIDGENCNGCGLCSRQCPQEAVIGELKEIHKIDQSKCSKCGICFESCKFEAVMVK